MGDEEQLSNFEVQDIIVWSKLRFYGANCLFSR